MFDMSRRGNGIRQTIHAPDSVSRRRALRVGELEPESGASRARTIRSIGGIPISSATISHARDVTISLVIPAKLERRFFAALISYDQQSTSSATKYFQTEITPSYLSNTCETGREIPSNVFYKSRSITVPRRTSDRPSALRSARSACSRNNVNSDDGDNKARCFVRCESERE